MRRAILADIPAMWSLERACEREGSIRGFRASSLTRIRRTLNDLVLVACVGTRIIGSLTARESVADANACVRRRHRICEILDVFVLGARRQEGVGSQLIQAVIDECRKRRIRFQYLSTASRDLVRIMRFYQRFGFHGWYATMYRQDSDVPSGLRRTGKRQRLVCR